MAPHDRAPVLVTGATGKTGTRVVAQLRQWNVPTVALVHREDARSESLRSIGATIVVGDFADIASLRRATAGVRAVYLCLPPEATLLEWTATFIAAARSQDVRRVVNMSQIHVREGHASPLTRQHWLAERLLDLAAVGAVHLRTTFFAEGYLILGAPALRAALPLCLPFGKGKVAPVACADVGRVAAAILSHPDREWHDTYTVTGPALLDHDDIARVFSAVSGRPITYVDTPLEAWRAAALGAGLPPFLVEHFSRTAEDLSRGMFEQVTDVVARIGGTRPIPFDEALRAAGPIETPAEHPLSA
jgi:uncharacterized protein YbjT (DUF2867 family)